MSNKAYSRLDATDRRAQLLEIGCELFATRPYDEVWIDHVADKAGVSRGLLYHHFENKRVFLHAIVEHETRAILEATKPDVALPSEDRLLGALDQYFRYVEAHPHGYRTLFRGAPATDSEVRKLIDDNLTRQEKRIVSALSAGGTGNDRHRLIVRGWIGLVITVALDWLDHKQMSTEEVRDLCADALLRLVATGSAGVPTSN